MLWLLVADHHDSDSRDYSTNDVLLFSGFLLVLLLCVFGVWATATPQGSPHIIRHTIVLPPRHRREIDIEPC